MPTTLTQPDAAPAPAAGDSPLDLQRSALRDLVALATESATTESRIERDFHAATEQAAKELDKAVWTLRQRYESAKDQVRNKHRDAVAQVTASYGAGEKAVETETVPRVAKIDRDHESIEHALGEKLNHAIWLAESVHDVSQNQARAEYGKVKEKVTEQGEALAALEQQEWALLQQYRVAPGATPTDAPRRWFQGVWQPRC